MAGLPRYEGRVVRKGWVPPPPQFGYLLMAAGRGGNGKSPAIVFYDANFENPVFLQRTVDTSISESPDELTFIQRSGDPLPVAAVQGGNFRPSWYGVQADPTGDLLAWQNISVASNFPSTGVFAITSGFPGVYYEPDDVYYMVNTSGIWPYAPGVSPSWTLLDRDTVFNGSAVTSFISTNRSGIDWSPNGEYMAIGQNSGSPRVRIYRRVGFRDYSICSISGSDSSNVNSVCWIDNDTLLVGRSISGTPYIINRTGATTFAADPGNNPLSGITIGTGAGQLSALSSALTGCDIVLTADKQMLLYASGNNFTSGNLKNGVFYWNPSTSKYVYQYSVGNPTATNPVSASFVESPDQKFIIFIQGGGPYIIFEREGATLTHVLTPETRTGYTSTRVHRLARAGDSYSGVLYMKEYVYQPPVSAADSAIKAVGSGGRPQWWWPMNAVASYGSTVGRPVQSNIGLKGPWMPLFSTSNPSSLSVEITGGFLPPASYLRIPIGAGGLGDGTYLETGRLLPTGATGTMAFLFRLTGGTSTVDCPIVGIRVNNSNGVTGTTTAAVWVSSRGGRLGLIQKTDSSANAGARASYTPAATDYRDGEWHLAVIRHDGTTPSISVDGVDQALDVNPFSGPTGTHASWWVGDATSATNSIRAVIGSAPSTPITGSPQIDLAHFCIWEDYVMTPQEEAGLLTAVGL